MTYRKNFTRKSNVELYPELAEVGIEGVSYLIGKPWVKSKNAQRDVKVYGLQGDTEEVLDAAYKRLRKFLKEQGKISLMKYTYDKESQIEKRRPLAE